MAKAIVTFVDDDEVGVKVTCVLDPPASNGVQLTDAQTMGLAVVEDLSFIDKFLDDLVKEQS